MDLNNIIQQKPHHKFAARFTNDRLKYSQTLYASVRLGRLQFTEMQP